MSVEKAHAVADQVKSLVLDRHFEGTVGVVTPFQAHAGRIRELLNVSIDADVRARTELMVNTARGFQGDEGDLIFFSPSAGPDMSQGAQYFLGVTGNLFNVAITRARTLLHVVGDREACSACGISHIASFANFATELQEQNKNVPGRGILKIRESATGNGHSMKHYSLHSLNVCRSTKLVSMCWI